MDRGAWWAAVYGVAQSRTRLKRLSSSNAIKQTHPGGSAVKVSACQAGDVGSIPESGRSPGEGNGNLLQYSCLENSTDRGAWLAIVLGIAIAKSLQSCPTLCDPIDGSPPGFPIPGILQARTLEWVAISFSNA